MRMIPEALIAKIRNNIEKIGSDLREFPPCTDGNYLKDRERALKIGHIFNWTQSFFAGMALWAYVDTEEKEFADWAVQFQKGYYDKLFLTPLETMHDLGFLYSTYAVMLYHLTGKEEFKAMGIRAADILAMRYMPNGGYIRAWGRMDDRIPEYVEEQLARDHFFTESRGLAIIDCMMNLPILFWAGRVTGHPFYGRVAEMHADTIMKYFIREDGSVMHAYRFSEETGEALGEENYCGFAKGSHWARGTAWAIYGFAIAHRYTGEGKYLETSLVLLHKFMEECKGDIPVWDFRLPEEEEKALDTSAAAITLCGIIELRRFEKEERLKEYQKSLRSALEKCIDYDESVMGILKEQNGRRQYSSYGDYYLLEAMMKENTDIEVW